MALGAAALFGASTPLAKLLLTDIAPWLLAALLYLGAGLGLAGILIFRRWSGAPRREAALGRADLPWLAAVVLAGGVVAPVLLMVGLSGVSAAVASLLLNLEGLFTILIAWRMFGENLGRRIALGAALILAGATLLSWRGEGGPAAPIAIAAIAGACLAWAIDNNLTRRLTAVDPVQVAAVKGLVAGSVNLALALSAGTAWPATGAVVAAGIIGFLGYGVSLVLFLLALRHVGTARTAAYFSTAPFLGASLAVPLLGEPITASLLTAAVLIGAGVWLHLAERHEHRHLHRAMNHSHAHRHDLHHRHVHSPDDPPGDFHVHAHHHEQLAHSHPHYPDLHHAHEH